MKKQQRTNFKIARQNTIQILEQSNIERSEKSVNYLLEKECDKWNVNLTNSQHWNAVAEILKSLSYLNN